MSEEESPPDGMLAYLLAIKNPSRNDPNWPLPSFDAVDWAKAFVEIAAKNGHPGRRVDDLVVRECAHARLRRG